ncbi:MAG: large-conductance mechanosensitive channel protein MscL [Lachnospiraceae bacterium]|nr:large-conductance mechanosensitive channel protein MscL [Lachnospiraceae bacterium]
MANETVNKAKGFFGEFREFIQKGNVMDMAVGVIIGAAFKAIVDSLVNDILMPIIGIFVGADSFTSLSVTVGNAVVTYGNFISAIINFLIMAFVMFLIVKGMNKMKDAVKKEEEAAAETPAEPSKEEVLLTEIRDLLKAK